MKKLAALLLAVIMLFTFAACGEKDDKASADAGYYIMTSMTAEGETYDEAMLKEYDMYGLIYLVLNEDKTGCLCMGEDEASDITWEPGKLMAEGETVSYTLKDNELTLDLDGVVMIFTRSSETPPAKPNASTPASSKDPKEPTKKPSSISSGTSGGAAGEPVSGTIGDFDVTIVAAEKITDSSGSPAIRFYYDVTNNSDELETAWSNLSTSAFQEGYELIMAYTSLDDQAPEYGNDSRRIQPGVTIRCVAEYGFKPDGGAIEFTLADMFENDGLTMEFDPKNLPGRPEELEIPPIDDPIWTNGMSTEGVYDEDYYVTIDSYEYTTGYGDMPLVRIYFEFTNNSSEATSFYMATYLVAMQDGVGLNTAWASEETLEDEAFSEDVSPGESILVSECFELRSVSPIEIIVEDFWGESTIGAVIPAA